MSVEIVGLAPNIWSCENCLLDTAWDQLECKYCEAPKSLYDEKRQREQQAKQKEKDMSAVVNIEDGNDDEEEVAGTGGIDDPIMLDDDPVLIVETPVDIYSNEDVIDLLSVSSTSASSKSGDKRSISKAADACSSTCDKGNKKVKLEFECKKFGEANDPEGEVIEVLPPQQDSDNPTIDQKTQENISTSRINLSTAPLSEVTDVDTERDIEDVVFLSSNATMSRDMPHARHSCPVYVFQKGDHDHDHYTFCSNRPAKKFSTKATEQNAKYCANCYCYVCDIPAKECSKWKTKLPAVENLHRNSHCNASDDENRWQKARQIVTNKLGQILIKIANVPSSTSCYDIIPSIVQSTLDATKEVANDIDQSYNSYEIGNLRYRNHMSWLTNYDSDDSAYNCYNHDFSAVADSARTHINQASSTLLHSNIYNESSRINFVKTIMILVEISRKFVPLEYNLPKLSYGNHTYDDRAKEKYDEILKLLSSRWTEIFLDKKIDKFDGLRLALESSVLDMGGGLKHLYVLARNGWGEKGGTLERLRDNTILNDDLETLKEMKWLLDEPASVKSARCNYLVNKFKDSSAVKLYAVVVGEHENYARALHQTYLRTKTLTYLIDALKTLTKVEEFMSFTLTETLSFLEELTNDLLKEWKTNDEVEYAAESIAHAFALVIISCFQIREVCSSCSLSAQNIFILKCPKILRYCYAFFMSNVPGTLADLTRNAKQRKFELFQSRLFIDAIDWVKRVLRSNMNRVMINNEEKFMSERPSDALANTTKWWQLSVGGMVSILFKGEEDYINYMNKVIALLVNGYEIQQTSQVEISSKKNGIISDELSCVSLIHYIEHCLNISPTLSDSLISNVVYESWNEDTHYSGIPFEWFPKSLTERLIQNKSRWGDSHKFHLIKSLANDSMVYPWFQLLSSMWTSSGIIKFVFSIKNRFYEHFQNCDLVDQQSIITNLTKMFDSSPIDARSLFPLEMFVKLKMSCPKSYSQNMILEKSFKTSALRTLDMELKKDYCKNTVLAAMFVLGKTKPLLDAISKTDTVARRLSQTTEVLSYFSNDSILFCLLSQETMLPHLVSMIEKFFLFLEFQLYDDSNNQKMKVLSNIIALLGRAISKSLSSNQISFEALFVKSLLKLKSLCESKCDRGDNDINMLSNVMNVIFMNVPELPEQRMTETKDEISKIFALLMEDFKRKYSKSLFQHGSSLKIDAIRVLCSALIGDIKLFKDNKYSHFVSVLHEVFGYQSYHCNEEWILMIHRVLNQTLKYLVVPEYQINASYYLDYGTIRDYPKLFDENKLCSKTKDEITVAPLFVSDGPLELFVNIGLFYFTKNWNEASIRHTSLDPRIFQRIIDGFNLSIRNPILHQKLECFTMVNDHTYKLLQKLKNFKEFLNQTIEVSINEKAEMSAGVFIKSAGTSSDKVKHTYDALISNLARICVKLIGNSTERHANCVPNLVALWPLSFSVSHQENESTNMNDEFIKDFLLKQLSSTKNGMDRDKKLKIMEGILYNLDAQCSNEQNKGIEQLVKTRLYHLIKIFATLININLSPERALKAIPNRDFCLFETGLKNFVNKVKRISSFEGNQEFTKLRTLLEPHDIVMWKNLVAWGQAISFLELVLCRTRDHHIFIDALISINEDWTKDLLSTTLLAYYRVSPLHALKYITTIVQLKNWDRTMLGSIFIAASADLRCRRDFTELEYLDYPTKGTCNFPKKCSIKTEQMKIAWETLRNTLKNHCNIDSLEYRFLYFCFDPFSIPWKDINATKRLENYIFTSLRTSRKPWDRGFYNIFVIKFLQIGVESGHIDCVKYLLENIYTECTEFAPNITKMSKFTFYPVKNQENLSMLGNALKSNSKLQSFYEKYVIKRCLDDSFNPWQNDGEISSFVGFIKNYIPSSWLIISGTYLLSKRIKSYVQLEKDMFKSENKNFHKMYEWDKMNAKIMKSLCPKGSITLGNIESFVESWIFLYEMKKETNSSTVWRKTILESLIPPFSLITSYSDKRESNAASYVTFLKQIEILLEKFSFLHLSDFEALITCIFMHIDCLSEFLRNLQNNLADISSQQVKVLTLRCLFDKSLREMNTNTITSHRKSLYFNMLVNLSLAYKNLSLSQIFRRQLEDLKATLRRKKTFLAYLMENRGELHLKY